MAVVEKERKREGAEEWRRGGLVDRTSTIDYLKSR